LGGGGGACVQIFPETQMAFLLSLRIFLTLPLSACDAYWTVFALVSTGSHELRHLHSFTGTSVISDFVTTTTMTFALSPLALRPPVELTQLTWICNARTSHKPAKYKDNDKEGNIENVEMVLGTQGMLIYHILFVLVCTNTTPPFYINMPPYSSFCI
jgi:hypothetical protein